MAKKTLPKKEPPVSVKGMRDIIGSEYYKYEGFLEKASEIAMYYGFQPIDTPILEKEELFRSGIGESTDIVEKEMYALRTRGGDRLVLRPEETAPIMRSYIEHGMQSWPQPVSLYYKGPLFRHDTPQRGRYRQFTTFGLEMLGTSKSIADAEVIHTSAIILREAGLEHIVCDINSIGDKECRPHYIRELTGYYKKHIGDLCSDCKRRIKENPLRLLDCKEKKCLSIKEGAPQSVTFLCDGCRKHFKEVLEYLEALGIPYRLNNSLVRGLDYYTRTVFEITEEDEEVAEHLLKNSTETQDSKKKETTDKKEKEEPAATPLLSLCGGGRYDFLARALGARKDIPGVGVGFGVDRIFLSKQFEAQNPRIVKQPKVFFIQLGFDAKLKSLGIIEILRKAKMPLTQSLAKDSLGSQLAAAEKLRVPYSIIFGQKEALDETVIIRDMHTRSQDTVPIKDLGKYIKGMK